MTSIEAVLTNIEQTNAWQEELYVQLHQNGELSMQETETAAEITRRLDSYGYVTHQIGGGVVGVLENGAGPTVLFRADIDALPVKEATGLPYASTKTMAASAILYWWWMSAMMGIGERGTICASPSAASASLQVQRTMSQPAAASA